MRSVPFLLDKFPTFTLVIGKPLSIKNLTSIGETATIRTFCPSYLPERIFLTATSLVIIEVLTLGGAARRTTAFLRHHWLLHY